MPAKTKVSSWLERNAEDEESEHESGPDGSEAEGVESGSESEDELEERELGWDERVIHLRRVLVDRKELTKVAVLQDDWRITEDHPPQSVSLALARTLITSLPHINSRAALFAVSHALIELVKRDERRQGEDKEGVEHEVLELLTDQLEYGSSPDKTIAPSTLHTSYIVTLHLLLALSRPPPARLIPVLGRSYELLRRNTGDSRARLSIRNWVASETRKFVHLAGDNVQTLAEGLLDATNDANVGYRSIPFLGVIANEWYPTPPPHVGRPKSTANGDAVRPLGDEFKDRLVKAFVDKVISGKEVVDEEIYGAIDSVIVKMRKEEISKTILEPMEKALVKTPDSTIPVASHLLRTIQLDLSTEAPKAILPAVIATAKSSSQETRNKSSTLLSALLARCESAESRKAVAGELLGLLSKAKTTSVDNKITLINLVGAISPDEGVSQDVVPVMATLMSKETAEPTMRCLGSALASHLGWCFLPGHALPNATSLQALVKDMSSTKSLLRKHVADAVGEAMWTSGRSEAGWSAEARSWADAVIPALGGYLKATSTTSAPGASNVGGALMEGYIGVAIGLGPLSAVPNEKSKNFLAKDPVMAGIANLAPKPSFLLSDRLQKRVIQENADPESSIRWRIWLLRALDALVERQGKQLNVQQRLACANPMIDLAIRSYDRRSTDVARATVDAVLRRQSKIASPMFVEALTAWLKAHSQGKDAITESTHVPVGRSIAELLRRLVTGITSKGGDDKGNKSSAAVDSLLLDVLVLCHHSLIRQSEPQAWIDLVLSASRDPGALASQHQETLLQTLLSHLPPANKEPTFAEAAYGAAATLAFVSPSVFVPAFLRQIEADLDPASLAYIGDEEFGIWQTPEGTTFVDALAQKKDNVAENKNSKTYAQDKWDLEVKKELEAKRAAASNGGLSKADQALVNAQLAREQAVREKIKTTQATLLRGLNLMASLIHARPQEVVDLISHLTSLLFDSAFGRGAFLVGSRAYEVYMDLSGLCADRLGLIRPFIGIGLLRSRGVEAVPERFTQEPLPDLIIRVLHRCLSFSQQSPLDAATFCYLLPLMSRVIHVATNSRESNDELQEQLTLVVEIVSTNSTQFSQPTFPRLQVIRDLLTLARSQPGLAKSAITALIEVSAAIAESATRDEIDALLSGLLSAEGQIRHGVLQALQPLDLTELDYSNELFMARFDDEHPSARLADHIWEDNGLDVSPSFVQELLPFLSHQEANVRSYAGRAIAEGTSQHLERVHDVIEALRALYEEKARIRAPEFDQFGMVIPESLDDTDPYPTRSAIASCLTCLAPYLQSQQLDLVFDFLVKQEALGDRSQEVRSKLLETGTALIDMHGETALPTLMAMFEDCLAKTSSSGATGDHVKEAVIILFGRLSKHLDQADERLPRVIDRLLDALETPSEIVQAAVGDCLPPLIRMQPESHSAIIDRLIDSLTTGSKYAVRRGAAYGLAGAVKGCGLSALHEYEIISRLQEATEDKKNYQSRQGAVFAFETLSSTLGRAFEPYIISIIPWLLTLFGDTNADVREATADAAKAIMATISGYCVKQILPLLLSGLEEKQWRTKKGSIELLGMMAFCAPKQLSMSLPTIIPQLTSTLTDSHAQVRTAANNSLKRFGEVLSNPEIKRLQPILLKALIDPSSKTNSALTSLLGTSFEHYLDAPSLALVIPILDRGLKDRGSEMKKRSVQIVGNMASLTESKDFIPYLDQLMPLVQNVLVDPVPEARATAAKALGTLVERLGEDNFPSLVTTLLQTLRSDTSGVDRQGAAQGLSEVLSGLGMDRMEGLLPDIVTYASSNRPYVREGFISLLVYLPATFGQRFAPHLGRIIPPILGGLADESEYVRDASMRAGKMIIANYSAKAIDLLLPELERGMLDSAWRIRQSSISLTGELLYRVAGISGKVEIEEDEAPAQHLDSARKALTEALGQEGRDRVLATLYIVRQDSVSVVRQASIHIWKALVHNTPKTTREILPMLISMILNLLGSSHHEQREVASRTLGELCRKNGERILAEVIPILSKGVASADTATREGACLAFSEIMDAATEEQIEVHEDAIIAAVRSALVDESSSVRMAAAQTFDSMMQHIGNKAIDETIPTLLEAMRTPGEASDTALMALREVMSVRAASVFPTLLPTLTVTPISAFNARALASLVTVAGNALSKRLTSVLTPLVKSLESEKDEEVRHEVDEALRALLASVEDNEGLHSLMMTLLGWAKDVNPSRRATACSIFAMFCDENELDASEYRIDWIRQLVSLMDDSSDDVVEAAWSALDTLVKQVPKEELEDLVVPLRRSIESTGAPGRTVPGFCRPKGVQPIIPILLAGVLSGTQEQREQAAFGIGDIVQRTSEAAIKPYIIQLTGPLIRVISSQAIAAQIKGAILSTLTVLLEEVPQLVRPFHPQLTRTFVKSASDPASLSVRNRAVAGLGELMKHQLRVDPLITELATAIRSAESDIAPSIAEAIAAVCRTAGKNLGAPAKQSIIEICEEAFAKKHNDSYCVGIGKIVASLSLHDSEVVEPIVRNHIIGSSEPSPLRSNCILQILDINPSLLQNMNLLVECSQALQQAISLDQLAVSRPAREAKAILGNLE